MKVLFISLYPPNPPIDGGRIRTYNILNQVAMQHEVTLVCFEDPHSSKQDLNLLSGLCRKVLVIPKPVIKKRGWLRKMINQLQKKPIGLISWSSLEMYSILENEMENNKYTLIHFDHILLAQYAPTIAPLPWVLTHHNIEALSQERQHSVERNRSWMKRLSDYRERGRWKWYEIDVSRKANALVTVSEMEAEYFRRYITREKVFNAPNGVDLDYFTPAAHSPSNPCLLFTGRMDYPPNVDAMTWFCREIWPIIRQEYPDLSCKMVGRDPTPEIQSLKGKSGIEVTGKVEDVRPYFKESTLFIAPLRYGGGTRLKILEALAMGLPVVSTHLGCEGLEVEDEKHLLIADSPENFADNVVRLLRSSELSRELGTRGRHLVEEKYGWEQIALTIESAYEYVTCIVNT